MGERLATALSIGDINPGICSSCRMGGAEFRPAELAANDGELGRHGGEIGEYLIAFAPAFGAMRATWPRASPDPGLSKEVVRGRSTAHGSRNCPIVGCCSAPVGAVEGDATTRRTGANKPDATVGDCPAGTAMRSEAESGETSGELRGSKIGDASRALPAIGVESAI